MNKELGGEGENMEHGFDVVTTPQEDGKIVQELYSVSHDIREQIMRRVMDTQEQQVRLALIALGWTPPNASNERPASAGPLD